jgi:hypothetical protein
MCARGSAPAVLMRHVCSGLTRVVERNRLNEEAHKGAMWAYEAPTTDPRDVEAMKLANPASWISKEFLCRQAEDPELPDAAVLQLHGCVWAPEETTSPATSATA